MSRLLTMLGVLSLMALSAVVARASDCCKPGADCCKPDAACCKK